MIGSEEAETMMMVTLEMRILTQLQPERYCIGFQESHNSDCALKITTRRDPKRVRRRIMKFQRPARSHIRVRKASYRRLDNHSRLDAK
ncbi:likely mitochondrial ribosomal protein [Pseudozyma hubeiensis SY62]|uniref:Likely mitochondrial ribosomal protein n=1 Tax=Pseudozyma hubeiensis (strain SY62) TaxID=1305764 RepID=R9NZJ1_PSEHS|nr:likely mitochondrial ribosomal protein [Pseudozyma hubeiensis SY62]GAC94137.1 likely mitochondrial ribosomal protein [Pseudozyma hubeiensis SY62]